MSARVNITPDMLGKMEQHAAQGLSEEQIAISLGISYSTFQRKKKDTEEIDHHIKRGRAKGVGTITNKLFQRAQGFYIEEEKVFCHQGEIVTHTIKKYFAPDLGSMAFYLKNRDPDNWKERHHVESTHRHTGLDREVTETMTPQEAAESYADTLRQGNGGNVVSIKRRK
jgi:hypothetical protein